MVMCQSNYAFPVGTTPQNVLVDHGELFNTDEFTTLANQYSEYNIRYIRYDVYDIAPAISASAFWSTFHTVGNSAPVTLAAVIDRPDCKQVPAGVGKISLTWSAKSPQEKLFQPTSGGIGTLGGPVNYGGLVGAIQATNNTNGNKFTVVAKFIVHFRGRQ